MATWRGRTTEKWGRVEGHYRRDAEALGQGNDAGVRASKRQVVVLLDEVGHPAEVRGLELCQREGAIGEGPRKASLLLLPGVLAQAGVAHPATMRAGTMSGPGVEANSSTQTR